LNILHLYFSIYFVELELHDRKVNSAHLCYGLTRTDLSFLENLRSIWALIIGLELLSLACPGLGLGSKCYTILLMSPCQCSGYFGPISVDNRIWGDENGTCRRNADRSRLLFGAMLEACG
jgi:hypothetical protein